MAKSERTDNRAEYERLAQAFLTMCSLEHSHVTPILDVESLDREDDDHVLMNAIEEHLRLVWQAVDWFQPEAMKLYVEMRVLIDEQTAERERHKLTPTEE